MGLWYPIRMVGNSIKNIRDKSEEMLGDVNHVFKEKKTWATKKEEPKKTK